MLAKKYRVSGINTIEKVKNEGTLYQSESFGIIFFNRGDNKKSRFGFIVSKKISPDATMRNKIKRALSEGVRFQMSYLKNGYDILFLAKPNIIRKYTEDIMREVQISLKQIDLAQ